MNVDHEDELRIQAPPGAASASERWLQLDGTGMMPEAQERKQSATAHTNSLRGNLKEKILRRRSIGFSWRGARERESLVVKQKEIEPVGRIFKPLFGKCQVRVPAFQRARRVPAAPTFAGRELTPESRRGSVR